MGVCATDATQPLNCARCSARKFDVDAAAALVQEIIDYRAQHALDGLAERILQGQPLQDAANPNWKPEIKDPSISRVLPHLPCGRHGFTRNGQPIEIWRISMLRPADILTVDRDDLWNWWHFHLECGLKAVLDGAAKFKATPTGSILVFDLKGFGARHLNRACLNVLKTLFAVGSSKAPESTSKIFILNAPTIFSGVRQCCLRELLLPFPCDWLLTQAVCCVPDVFCCAWLPLSANNHTGVGHHKACAGGADAKQDRHYEQTDRCGIAGTSAR